MSQATEKKADGKEADGKRWYGVIWWGKDAEPQNQKLDMFYDDFKNKKIEVERKCTDILFIVVIVAVWIIMTGIGIDAFVNGEPYRLWAPMDSQGFFCGYSQNVTDSPYLYFIDTNLRGKCVEECPTEDLYPATVDDLICLDGLTIPSNYPVASLISEGYCQRTYETVASFKRCIFTNDTLASLYDTSELSGGLEEFISDVVVSKDYIFGLGFCLALILGYIFTTLLRIPKVTEFLVWGILLLIALGICGTTPYLLSIANTWDEQDPQIRTDYEIQELRALGWFFIITLILYVCLIVFLRKWINFMIGMIKETSRAVDDMPLIFIVPIIQLTGFVLFMIPWMYYVVYTAGMATITETTDDDGYITRSLSFEDELLKRALVYIFVFFWTTEFIKAMGQIILSMCFSKWYFKGEVCPNGDEESKQNASNVFRDFWRLAGKRNDDKKSGDEEKGGDKGRSRKNCICQSKARMEVKDLEDKDIVKAIGQGLFYHMGTAAFGSLFIAPFRLFQTTMEFTGIRAVLTYMNKSSYNEQQKDATSTNEQQKDATSTNKQKDCISKSISLCILKYLVILNKNVYIQTALFSENFCVAARHAMLFWIGKDGGVEQYDEVKHYYSGRKDSYKEQGNKGNEDEAEKRKRVETSRLKANLQELSLVTELISFLGKVFISGFSTLLSYFAINDVLGDELHSVAGPTLLVFCLSYVVVCVFMSVAHCGIDTIIHCLLVDKEIFKNSNYASEKLHKYMQRNLGFGDKLFITKQGKNRPEGDTGNAPSNGHDLEHKESSNEDGAEGKTESEPSSVEVGEAWRNKKTESEPSSSQKDSVEEGKTKPNSQEDGRKEENTSQASKVIFPSMRRSNKSTSGK